jgi:hypothetical protein
MSTTTLGPTVGLSGHAPSPPRYRLLDAATIVPDEDLHYLAGTQVWPWIDARSGGVHNPCSTGTNREKNGQQDFEMESLPTFASFTVYETIECTSRSISEDYNLWAERAMAALRATESHHVEAELSKGLKLPLNPHFALTSTSPVNQVLNGGASMAPELALALLEQEASVTGAAHLVHIDPATAVAFSADHLVEKEGADLRVKGTGSRVVVGSGYVGAEPDGGTAASATLSWAWATGPIEVRRSEMFVNPGSVREAMDLMQNDITIRAERYYMVTWDTVLTNAVLVNRAA